MIDRINGESHICKLNPLSVTRRTFLAHSSTCLGTTALASLLAAEARPVHAASQVTRGVELSELPHFAPTAKRVIYLFMAGGPSHIDLFDFKPALRKIHGTELPGSVRRGERLTTLTSGQPSFPCVAPMFPFDRRGERGTWINSELLPHTASMVDTIAIIRSMISELRIMD